MSMSWQVGMSAKPPDLPRRLWKSFPHAYAQQTACAASCKLAVELASNCFRRTLSLLAIAFNWCEPHDV